ncbi:Nitric oxide reductase FlRd-NAD(+) reductase [Candidatus Lokiarchaeum ossiferum]|uniref:Nitric oxide reductase FlRd-NAD(+) reductase n=1 Tax=Candidatus Lokiarchaeum ossiferum TaxID=2951803 RepID=A0ABY6HKJ9_9ARCH|nr:Nitric oxide reductase FlRd-NAD(+) reductase [Candidatus Lokiarchaeum sp. B-35]
MKIIIIGNGIAGQTVADLARKQDPNALIDIYSKELYPYYSRIFLPQYIANEKSLDNLIVRNEKWFEEKNINLHLGIEVETIFPQKKQIKLKNQQELEKYDKLFIATGSNARFLPFDNPSVEGMFTLRNIKDADEIKRFIEKNRVKDVLIIGGGLLGIELGYHLRELNLNVSICEISNYLLPRQLDEGTSKLLQKYLESKGINIICGQSVSEVLGKDQVEGIRLKSGKSIKFQMILQQMGIIPEISIAKNAGLDTERGILVNEYLQTSDPDILAVGDCVQFNGLIWGIIPASIEQSKIAVQYVFGQNPEPYLGTFWNTRLKIAGLKLSCFGEPPTDQLGEEQLLENIDEDSFICRKVTLENNKIKGAILMGPGKDSFFLNNLGKEVDKEELKRKINE